MRIEAVLFDLDNTLTHRDLSVQAYSRHFLEHYSNRLNLKNTEQKQSDLNTIIDIIRRIDHGGYPKKELLTHPSIAASVGFALLQELDWKQAPELDELTEFWFSEFGLSAVAMTGAEALLKQLKQRGFKLAVISNGGHATRLRILQGLGFADYFDEILSSELVGISKPKAEIFLYSCAKLQVEPKYSLYIGDHPINDFQGATDAGLNALLILGFHEQVEHIPKEKTIHQLDEIWTHLGDESVSIL
ncbi:HAD family hydrolase [Acinetobacter shaoyimingii]|uniref:HAD family hydrolase n=1 Tax=Acinetobacter shaoyimingii TaxID=2715164 RepID=A0A6G8RXE3_9GAMM|nr:HAD family hydrolase [Acinetobacter shaoyimingii]